MKKFKERIIKWLGIEQMIEEKVAEILAQRERVLRHNERHSRMINEKSKSYRR